MSWRWRQLAAATNDAHRNRRCKSTSKDLLYERKKKNELKNFRIRIKSGAL
jgi:hypothetical protein